MCLYNVKTQFHTNLFPVAYYFKMFEVLFGITTMNKSMYEKNLFQSRKCDALSSFMITVVMGHS